MEFNESKCKVIDISRSNLGRTVITMECKFGDRDEHEETCSERDLGLLINSKLKWDDQVDQAALKTTSVLGLLKQTVVHLNASL